MTFAEYLEAGAPNFARTVDQIGEGSIAKTIFRLYGFRAVGFKEDLGAAQQLIWDALGLPAPSQPLELTNVTAQLRGGAFEDHAPPDIAVSPREEILLQRFTRRDRLIYAVARTFLRRSATPSRHRA